MATQITATLPTLDFPREVDYPTQEDWAAFSAAAEENFGILGGSWSTQMQLWKDQANTMSVELNNNADIAQSIANYQGDWTSKGYTLGQSVSVSGVYYICKLTHTTGQNPTAVGSLYWNLALGNWNLKVDKVTSTDNAVPRFNGINGNIQNSINTIDDFGNIGIGGNPSPLGTGYIGANIINNGELFSSSTSTFLANNLYFDGANYRYKNNGTGSVIYQNSGQFVFANAVSGVAGDVATLRSSVLSANFDLTLGGASMSGGRALAILSGTISDGQEVTVGVGGGTAGTVNRAFNGGIYKHAGITNACGFYDLVAEDSTHSYFWVDNVDVFRTSSTKTHIGTTNGTVVGTQTSDERVKNIEGTCPYGLQEILELETYKYSMKDDVEGSFKLGFVAQQAMGVIPESVYDTNERLTEAVTVTKYKVVQEAKEEITEQVIDTPAVIGHDGTIIEEATYKTVVIQEAQEEITEPYEDIEYVETEDKITKLAMDYQIMIPVLVNSVKEQQNLINSLTARLDRLEGNL